IATVARGSTSRKAGFTRAAATHRWQATGPVKRRNKDKEQETIVHCIEAARSMPPIAAPDSTRFILIGTSHAGNVGAAARAMKVMGFTDLVLVTPRFPDVLAHEEAVAMASSAQDVLASARVVSTLEEA